MQRQIWHIRKNTDLQFVSSHRNQSCHVSIIFAPKTFMSIPVSMEKQPVIHPWIQHHQSATSSKALWTRPLWPQPHYHLDLVGSTLLFASHCGRVNFWGLVFCLIVLSSCFNRLLDWYSTHTVTVWPAGNEEPVQLLGSSCYNYGKYIWKIILSVALSCGKEDLTWTWLTSSCQS